MSDNKSDEQAASSAGFHGGSRSIADPNYSSFRAGQIANENLFSSNGINSTSALDDGILANSSPTPLSKTPEYSAQTWGIITVISAILFIASVIGFHNSTEMGSTLFLLFAIIGTGWFTVISFFVLMKQI